MSVLRAIQIVEQYFNARIEESEKAIVQLAQARRDEIDFDRKNQLEQKRIQNVVGREVAKTYRDQIIEQIKNECLPKEGE